LHSLSLCLCIPHTFNDSKHSKQEWKKKKNIVNVLQTLVQWKIKVIKIDEDIVQVPFYDGCLVWMLVNIA
jgi:aspartate-semialdehyde dehydrogenase